MIEFAGVVKRYPGSPDVLKNLSVSIAAGEFVYLTGHSGAGKSTVMRLIAAIEKPTAGVVLVHHQNVGQLSRRSVPFLRRQLGMVLQDHRLLFDRTVLENVLVPLQIAGMDRREAARRARAALDKVGLQGREKSNPITLSGGEQQRVCLARAVVNRPALLIADEPTASLDAEYANDILEIFRDFHRVGVTVLVATHDEPLIDRFPGRRLNLVHGQVVGQ
ncbi:MAG: ATP-binding cassette domain-containing protein [Betaproteobacteria bacterium]